MAIRIAATLLKRLLLAAVMAGFASFATAHPAPFSYLDLHLDETGVRGALIIHDFDAAHELGLGKPEALVDPDVVRRHRDALVQIIDSRLRIRLDARAAAPKWGAIDVLAERQSVRLPFELSERGAGMLELDTVLFPYDPTHSSFINIYEDGRLKHQAILDGRSHTLIYYAGNSQGRWAVVRTFVEAGIHHIFIGVDHILFLLGLLLIGGSLWRMATIVTAFTVGHSITLSLATLGIVRVAPHLVEPAIALSIVVVGVDNLLVRKKNAAKWQSPSESGSLARDLRPWLAAAFGLIHGFGFASVLLEFGLPREALAWSLAAFNIGVEIGQLAIVMVIAAALTGLRHRSTVLAERAVLVGSIGVIAAGTYWFIQRIAIV